MNKLFSVPLLLLLAQPALAAWTPIGGPGGGGAFSSVSANGTTIYVTSDLGGLYKSTNAGVSWSAVTIKGTPIVLT